MPALLPAAGIAILLMTPLVERFDFLIPAQASSFLLTLSMWLGMPQMSDNQDYANYVAYFSGM